jgi:hypothetical protein
LPNITGIFLAIDKKLTAPLCAVLPRPRTSTMAQITPQQVKLASGEVLAPIGLGRATPAPPWRTKRAVWAVLAVALVGLGAGVAAKSSPAPYTGSDAAAFINSAADGATIELAAGLFEWKSEVTCVGKTLTLTGAGKGATVLDAGGARRFFRLNSGCTLVLRALSLRNGKRAATVGPGSHSGAIYANSGSTLSARDVEFKDNSATKVRCAPPLPPALARATAAAAHTRAHTHSPHPLAIAHNSGRRGVG